MKMMKKLTLGTLAAVMLSASVSARFDSPAQITDMIFWRPDRAAWCNKGQLLAGGEKVDDCIAELGAILYKLQEEHKAGHGVQYYNLASASKLTTAESKYVMLYNYIAAGMNGEWGSEQLLTQIAQNLVSAGKTSESVKDLVAVSMDYIKGTCLEKFIEEAMNRAGQNDITFDEHNKVFKAKEENYTGMVVDIKSADYSYTGDVEDGQLNGFGKEVYTYTGKREYAWPMGTVYEGEFKGGRITGQGKMTYEDGNVYEGEFKGGAGYWPG